VNLNENDSHYQYQAAGDLSTPPGGRDHAPDLSGDHTDDDGAYISGLLNPNPDLTGLAAGSRLAVPMKQLTELPKVADRILTTAVIAVNGGDAAQLIPADPNRKRLLIRGNAAASQPFTVTGEKPGIASASTPYFLTTDPPIDLGDYNGPVWVWAPNASGVVYVTALAVTI